MSEPFLGEIRIVSFGFPPKGWALCNGQILSINQNQALFSLMGTQYGGDGIRTFALPDLQARMPVHMGNEFVIGQRGGESTHALIAAEMPTHYHPAHGVSNPATSEVPAGNTWANTPANPYGPTPDTTLNPACVSSVGGGQPHENKPPFLVLNFVIALAGIYPSRN